MALWELCGFFSEFLFFIMWVVSEGGEALGEPFILHGRLGRCGRGPAPVFQELLSVAAQLEQRGRLLSATLLFGVGLGFSIDIFIIVLWNCLFTSARSVLVPGFGY